MAAVASGIEYEFQFMDLMKGEHKEEWFLKLNPKEKLHRLVEQLSILNGSDEF